MNIDQVHAPQRLQDEPFAEYKARRRMSARLLQRNRLLWSPNAGTYFSPKSNSLQGTRMLTATKEVK